MINTYDVGIVGVGTMGSAAAYHVAKRNRSVIAFEQFRIVHDLGSHSGSTRIIRRAYHESPDYVPLVLRSEELWEELEKQSGTKLLFRTGAICIGASDSSLIRGALLACKLHNLPYEQLSAIRLMDRWPQFRIPDHWEGCHDPLAGFLDVNKCIHAQAGAAQATGATIRVAEEVRSFEDDGGNVKILTDSASYRVSRLIVCAGAWASKLLPELPLVVKRKTLTWLQPKAEDRFSLGQFPIFLSEVNEGLLYGFPIYGQNGVKIANHCSTGVATDPNETDREFHPEDAAEVQRFAREYLPDLTENVMAGKVCLYTLTPDEDFIIDFHPRHENILIAAGFSGHGFKFSPVVGEILADLAIDGKTHHSIRKFRISRFS